MSENLREQKGHAGMTISILCAAFILIYFLCPAAVLVPLYARYHDHRVPEHTEELWLRLLAPVYRLAKVSPIYSRLVEHELVGVERMFRIKPRPIWVYF